MAEETGSEQTGDKKRRIKNPETFRERMQKSAETADKPSTAARIKQTGGQASGPLRRAISRAYHAKALAPLRKVLSTVGKVIIPKYFRQSWQELKLVTWPGWKEGRRLTFAVLVFAIIFGAAIAGVDWVINKIFQHLLLT